MNSPEQEARALAQALVHVRTHEWKHPTRLPTWTECARRESDHAKTVTELQLELMEAELAARGIAVPADHD